MRSEAWPARPTRRSRPFAVALFGLLIGVSLDPPVTAWEPVAAALTAGPPAAQPGSARGGIGGRSSPAGLPGTLQAQWVVKRPAPALDADQATAPETPRTDHPSPIGRFPWLVLPLVIAFLLTARKIARLS